MEMYSEYRSGRSVMEHQNIIIVHIGNVMQFPPILNLMENLLKTGRRVRLISSHTEELPDRILQHPHFQKAEITSPEGNAPLVRLRRRYEVNAAYRKALRHYDDGKCILWTTTDLTVRGLDREILRFSGRHVMQLMELEQSMPLFKGAKVLKYPIAEYAQRAWKVVVPEVNRAYIQKAWWNLKDVPTVLPNKPYDLDPGKETEGIQRALDEMRKEKRKIVLFLGNISADRDLRPFARAVRKSEGEYVLYLIGGVRDAARKQYDELMRTYGDCVRHLGYFPAPSHLHFLKYAYVGLLPYTTDAEASYSYSPLNVLYCAPNKIFEYAGYGVPMIGTDVLGLKEPFERYKIGVNCRTSDPDEILRMLKEVDAHHTEMSKNCKNYYDSVNLESIVNEILLE